MSTAGAQHEHRMSTARARAHHAAAVRMKAAGAQHEGEHIASTT